jgi:hypothetical protein
LESGNQTTTFDYIRLPTNNESYSRPVVNVQLEDMIEAPLACLVDSGAVQNRFNEEWADAAGVSLDEPDRTDVFFAGGYRYTGRIVRVRLKLVEFEWEAPVCFVKDWHQGFQLLGQEGFFRWFRVCFYAADEKLSISPAAH